MAKSLSKSKVEWAQGWLLCNAITGCLRRCDYCWAWDMALRFPERYLANDNLIRFGPSEAETGWGKDPFAPRWWPEQLDAVRRLRKPSRIWMCNTADAFGPWVPSLMLQEMLQVARDCPQHTFLWLTKYPGRLREFNPWPSNCLVGATVTDFQTFLASCFELEKVDAVTRFLSLEPLLGWPDNQRYAKAIQRADAIGTASALHQGGISWVITGPCNGRLAKKYPCKAEWLNSIAAACDIAKVPVFEKKECRRLVTRRELRKEFPKGEGDDMATDG
uniref:Radical SAM superfamily protein n=1 Tax=viral metagenome TaxID=1070528 RepID=A0A6M3KWB8_9ZZZZ